MQDGFGRGVRISVSRSVSGGVERGVRRGAGSVLDKMSEGY